ncbi:MAG: dual specificity protein phosphatase family protein [Syntrophaceae bacterium]|nr:dual specificity protein phosphatase family protein [Syntrophaceae bacterium]
MGSVLNVAEEVEVSPPNLKYHKIPLRDGIPIPPERMREALEWIREHIVREKVLVACHYGVGRSASIIIGYLCSIGFGYQEALDFVSSKRAGVNPIPGLEETIRKSFNHT